jgi:hypothetical protein
MGIRAALTTQGTVLENQRPFGDQTMNQLYGLYKDQASPVQRTYIDSLVTSQSQVRNINQQFLNALATIKDNSEPVP